MAIKIAKGHCKRSQLCMDGVARLPADAAAKSVVRAQCSQLCFYAVKSGLFCTFLLLLFKGTQKLNAWMDALENDATVSFC